MPDVCGKCMGEGKVLIAHGEDDILVDVCYECEGTGLPRFVEPYFVEDFRHVA